MPFTGKITARFQHDAIGPGNEALVDFDFNTIEDQAECAAAVLAYFGRIGGMFSNGTKVVGLIARAAGASGGVAIPFPSVAYAVLVATAGAPAWTSSNYGYVPGGSSLSMMPLGTSVSVSEVTAQPGPHGRGRHFLPYMHYGNVAVNGGLNPAGVLAIENAFRLCFGLPPQAGTPAPLVNVGVTSGVAGAPYYDVVTVKAQPVFSNLRSRRR